MASRGLKKSATFDKLYSMQCYCFDSFNGFEWAYGMMQENLRLLLADEFDSVGWQSVPSSLLETHELTSVSLQYKRECRASDIIQSLATPNNLAMPGEVEDLNMDVDKQRRYSCAERSLLVAFSSNPTWWINHEPLHLSHLLRTQKDATEIVRGKSTWRLKRYTAQ